MQDVVFVWETAEEEIVGMMNPEGKGEIYLHTHPEMRTPEVQEDMVTVAEEHLTTTGKNGQPRLRLLAGAHDTLRRDILIRRGYVRSSGRECERRRSMSLPVTEVPIPKNYSVRSLRGEEDLAARSFVSWRAFHPEEPEDRHEGWEWYRNIQKAPLYRRDLDLVVVAPDGEFASFCTVWFDDVTLTGSFEPWERNQGG
jgi:hypothetical protein